MYYRVYECIDLNDCLDRQSTCNTFNNDLAYQEIYTDNYLILEVDNMVYNDAPSFSSCQVNQIIGLKRGNEYYDSGIDCIRLTGVITNNTIDDCKKEYENNEEGQIGI